MNLQDPEFAFKEAARAKDRKGTLEHRGGDFNAPFVGNLFDEYEQEQLDSYNYLTRMFNAGGLGEEEYRRAVFMHLDLWLWIRSNVRER